MELDDDHANSPGASITATTGANWADPVHDAAGNTTSVPNPAGLASGMTCVNTGGEAVERYVYDPYGKPTIYNGDWSGTLGESACANIRLYTGREHDPNPGLYHYRERYYHPALGRLLNRDPVFYWSGDNLYQDCGNLPLTRSDPLGLKSPAARPLFDITYCQWKLEWAAAGGVALGC